MSRRQLAVLTLTAVLLTLVFATLASPASADTLAQKKAQAQAIMKQLDALNGKMEVAVEAFNAAAGKLAVVNQKIHDNERDLKIARYNLDFAKATLQARAVAMYKQQPADFLDVVLSSNSFDELITQVDMLDRLGRSDVDVIGSIQKYQVTIRDASTALAADQKAAEQLVAERAASKQSVVAALGQRQSLLKGVKDQIAALERQRQAASNRLATSIDTSTGTAPGPAASGILAIADRYKGVPYVYGGASPQTGFDCSGFTMYVYGQVGISLPHNAAAQYGVCTHISRAEAVPGDLVFFGSDLHHVGIYAGGNSMIHAPYTGAVVRYDTIYGDVFGFGRP